MSRAMNRLVLAAAVVCSTAGGSLAQQSSATETKSFEVLAVDGNQLVVRLPEGTRELTVADDFRFIINGQPMSVRQLKPGMKGTATVTTRTTVTPVTVTEVKDGVVAMVAASTIIVRTDEGFRSFTQGEVDKRGVKIMRNGEPVQLSQFREGDRLSATIITAQPPRVVTEREVNATLATAKPNAGAKPPVGTTPQSRPGITPAPVASNTPAGASGAPAAAASTGARNQDLAQDRQLVAAPRRGERPAAGGGVRVDDQAPLRPLGDFCDPGRARALMSERGLPVRSPPPEPILRHRRQRCEAGAK